MFHSTKDIFLVLPKTAPQVEKLLQCLKNLDTNSLIDGLSIAYFFHVMTTSQEILPHTLNLKVLKDVILVNNTTLKRNAFDRMVKKLTFTKLKPYYEAIFNVLFFASISRALFQSTKNGTADDTYIFGSPNFVLSLYGKVLAQYDVIFFSKKKQRLRIIPIEIKSLVTMKDLYDIYLKSLYVEHPKILALLGFEESTVEIYPCIVGVRLHRSIRLTDFRKFNVITFLVKSPDNIRETLKNIYHYVLKLVLNK